MSSVLITSTMKSEPGDAADPRQLLRRCGLGRRHVHIGRERRWPPRRLRIRQGRRRRAVRYRGRDRSGGTRHRDAGQELAPVHLRTRIFFVPWSSPLMVMRGRPLRATPADFDPAKLRKRIISPPRHGGKASVWRDRSAIPRAPRALFRFGNVGSFCQTPPCRRVPNRSRVLDRTPHCYSLLHFFFLFFIVICAGGNAGRERTKPRGTRRNSPPGSNARIVISLLLTMPRCGSAAHDTKRHARRPPTGRARAAPGKMLASILARFGAVLFTMSNSPVRALAAMRLPCARRAGPSALRIVSGRPLRMRIFLA